MRTTRAADPQEPPRQITAADKCCKTLGDVSREPNPFFVEQVEESIGMSTDHIEIGRLRRSPGLIRCRHKGAQGTSRATRTGSAGRAVHTDCPSEIRTRSEIRTLTLDAHSATSSSSWGLSAGCVPARAGPGRGCGRGRKPSSVHDTARSVHHGALGTRRELPLRPAAITWRLSDRRVG